MKPFKELTETLVSNWNPMKHGAIEAGREAMYKGDDVTIVKVEKNVVTLKNTKTGKEYTIKLQDFSKNATPFPLKEDAPANVSGGTGINSPDPNMANIDKPLVKREKFANKEVFEVDDNFYAKCIHGKSRYAKYSAYVGDDHTGEAIRQYGRANPKASIIVKNKNTQNMMYLRRINEETGEEMTSRDMWNRVEQKMLGEAALISVQDPQKLLNNKEYEHFVVVGNTIVSGWEFKEDAKDDAKENREGNAKFANVPSGQSSVGKVYARRALRDVKQTMSEAAISTRAIMRDGENSDKSIIAHVAWKEIPAGVSLVAASPEDKREFGKSVFRIRKGDMQYELIAKLNPKGMKLYFVDNKHYVNTDEVKWQEPIKLTKLFVYNKAALDDSEINEETKPINQKQDGDSGYVGLYKGKRAEVYSKTKYEAQQLLAKHFKAKKSYDVTVALAEKPDGSQYTHVAESTQLNEWGSHILATIELEKGQKGYLTRIPKTFKTKEKNVFIFYPDDRENGWQRAIKIDTKKGQYWDNIADEHEYDYAFNHGAGDKYKNLELSGQAKQTIKSFDEFLSEETLDESVLAAAMIGLTGVVYAKGYYEMSKDVYQHLKATIESRRKLAKQEGHGGILADYASEINKVAYKLEAIFAKAKITK